MAVAGQATGSVHWTVMGLEITLAVALFAVGVLIDRRASRRGRTTVGPGVRAIPRQGASTSVTLQVSGALAAGPMAGGVLRGGALAGEAGDQL